MGVIPTLYLNKKWVQIPTNSNLIYIGIIDAVYKFMAKKFGQTLIPYTNHTNKITTSASQYISIEANLNCVLFCCEY